MVDEIVLEALLLKKKTVEIIQDAWKMNDLMHKEASRTCQGCPMDDPSQNNFQCMMKREEEIWFCYCDEAKSI